MILGQLPDAILRYIDTFAEPPKQCVILTGRSIVSVETGYLRREKIGAFGAILKMLIGIEEPIVSSGIGGGGIFLKYLLPDDPYDNLFSPIQNR